jgi:hypothetical protein
VAAVLTSAASMQAAPFLAIGDGAELFVTGVVGIRADDNIFQSTDAGLPAGSKSQVVSDTIFEITPGLDLTFGKNSQLKGSFAVTDSFTNYADTSGINTNLFGADLRSSFEDGKLKLDGSAGYHELNQNSADIRGLTRRDVTNFSGKGEVLISEKTSVGASLTFERTNYKRASYTDQDMLTVPLNAYYKVSPKVDLSLGYRYRDTQVQKGSDSQDSYFNVGARGEFTPKFTGHFSIGYNKRSLTVGKDEDQLGFDADLAYELTPKTNLTFGASNDFSTSAAGQQQKNFSLNGRVSTKISEVWSYAAGLSYRASDYTTRTDDYLDGSLGVTYVINSYVGVTGTYNYRSNSSALAASEFTNNVFSIAANIRY